MASSGGQTVCLVAPSRVYSTAWTFSVCCHSTSRTWSAPPMPSPDPPLHMLTTPAVPNCWPFPRHPHLLGPQGSLQIPFTLSDCSTSVCQVTSLPAPRALVMLCSRTENPPPFTFQFLALGMCLYPVTGATRSCCQYRNFLKSFPNLSL